MPGFLTYDGRVATWAYVEVDRSIVTTVTRPIVPGGIVYADGPFGRTLRRGSRGDGLPIHASNDQCRIGPRLAVALGMEYVENAHSYEAAVERLRRQFGGPGAVEGWGSDTVVTIPLGRRNDAFVRHGSHAAGTVVYLRA